MDRATDSPSVRVARDAYFAANGFSEADYTARWVKLRVGPVVLGFPNSEARRRAVRLHDLHHVATGYATTWVGEGEIAAWELAAGCGRYYAAWVLDLGGFAVGLAIAPRRVYRAFVRGRHSTALYAGRDWRDAWLAGSVGELRAQLRLDRPAREATLGDRVMFAAYAAAVAVLPLAVVIGLALAAARLG